jgi:hypothetical protein
MSGTKTPGRCAGVVAAACTQGKRTQHGKPQGVVSDDQPDAREGQAGRSRVAERFAVPLKPVNAGGGKGPQFKTDARRGEGPEIGQPINSGVFRNCRQSCTGSFATSIASWSWGLFAIYSKRIVDSARQFPNQRLLFLYAVLGVSLERRTGAAAAGWATSTSIAIASQPTPAKRTAAAAPPRAIRGRGISPVRSSE